MKDKIKKIIKYSIMWWGVVAITFYNLIIVGGLNPSGAFWVFLILALHSHIAYSAGKNIQNDKILKTLERLVDRLGE